MGSLVIPVVKRFTIPYVDLHFKIAPICSGSLVLFYKIPRELPESQEKLKER